MSLLDFKFVIIYIIHKMLVLLKSHLNCLEDSIVKCFFFLKKNFFFSQHIITESLSLEKENIIKDIRKLFRLKKELNYTGIKDIRTLFTLEEETKTIKDKILRCIKNLFEHEKEEENYYKPVRVNNFWSNNYIEYESNSDTNKTLSVEEYL